MNRLHALVVAVLLGIAAVAGSYAALGTTALGVTATEATISDAQIAAREAKLDKAARALRRAAKRKPPALPPLPARRSSASLVAAPGSGTAVAPAPGPLAFRDHDHDSDDDWDDDRDDDDSHDDDSHDDDRSGHGGGGDDHD
ncbi:MAG: hypothetical protein ACRDPP_14010 [Gaiellaceae bacterium]